MQNANTVDNKACVIPGHSKKCFLSCNLMKAAQDKKGLLKVHPIECLQLTPACMACVWIKMESGFLRSLFFIELDTVLDKEQLQLSGSSALT